MWREMSRLFGDFMKDAEYVKEAYPQFADVVITSPPYAEQRKNQYGGIKEEDYPQWMVQVGEHIKGILKPEGSAFINIRPHLKNGEISDYVLKTRLALREAGWKECEELIWIKPDSPPLGSTQRPRRAWESILWFSPSNKPYCNPKAGGTESNRIGFEQSKFKEGGDSHIHGGQQKAQTGKARVKDYIEAGTSKVEKGFTHPAMFPIELPEYLIQLACPEDGMVVDPFGGTFTAARAAINLNRGFMCFEINDSYWEEGLKSVVTHIKNQKKEHLYDDFLEFYQATLDEIVEKEDKMCSVCNKVHLAEQYRNSLYGTSKEEACVDSYYLEWSHWKKHLERLQKDKPEYVADGLLKKLVHDMYQVYQKALMRSGHKELIVEPNGQIAMF